LLAMYSRNSVFPFLIPSSNSSFRQQVSLTLLS
jgi:hypothetical protein